MDGVLLLQFHDDVSDEEAVARCQFDMHWKVALDLPLDFAGFGPASLSYLISVTKQPVRRAALAQSPQTAALRETRAQKLSPE